jgi:DNA-binding beta-propeller fold protein YncE
MKSILKSLSAIGIAVCAFAGGSLFLNQLPTALAAAAPAMRFDVLPGMPPLLDPKNVYSASGAGMLSAVVKGMPNLVYVPNSKSDTVDIIDPATYKIVGHFALPKHTKGTLEPQHVIPSWDLKKLWVAQDLGDQLTEIDPYTGKEGKTIHVDDPYNMYYTPDGKYAIVMAEREKFMDFHDAQTMKTVNRLPVNCAGLNHADFSPDGRFMIATCEFSNEIIKVDVAAQKVIGHLQLTPKGMPQDCRLIPNGKFFYIANMGSNGVHIIDGVAFKQVAFVPTGKGAHGVYFSRDAKYAYISNRDEGTVSLMDVNTNTVAKKWVIPGGGSPDMGDVSVDGKSLWLSGRYNGEVYVFNTEDGSLRARIKVGKQPHGLCVYPQPGRYSLGHTGNMR